MPEETDTGASENEPGNEPATGDTTTNDDGQLGDAGKRALEQERRARREAEKTKSELEKRVKEFEDADKSEQQKMADELASARSTGSQTKAELDKLDVALEKAPEGMSPAKIRSLAKRLTGSSREDLETDAAELFAEFSAGGKPDDGRPKSHLRKVPIEGGGGEAEKTDMNSWMRNRSASE